MILKHLLGLLPLIVVCNGANNPLTYWTLPSGNYLFGPGEVSISRSQSLRIVRNVKNSIQSHNKVTLGAEFSVGGVLKLFDFGASFNAGYEGWTTSSSDSSQTAESMVTNLVSKSSRLGSGDVYLVAVEMRMYVFKTAEGETKHIKFATGKTYSGVFNKNSFNRILLDDTFSSIGRKFGLNYYTPNQLQSLTRGKIPTAKAMFPAEGVYYRIFNSKYSNSRVGKWARDDDAVGCGWWEDFDDQLWEFKRERGFPEDVYYIENKKYRGHRLADYTGNSEGKIITFGNFKYGDQKWKVTHVGSNRVRFQNAQTGKKFGMWGVDKCGIGYWSDTDDQIWELRRA